jgi:hypothetical protein
MGDYPEKCSVSARVEFADVPVGQAQVFKAHHWQ